MKDYDLSILIPARSEEFLANTVEDILKNKRGNTEVIIGLDGTWAEPGVPDHPDVRIIYSPVSLGQRGMTNLLCRLSEAKYVAKCDAHVAFDEGFDVKLMDHMQDDWTIVPIMRNLHVFNWKCDVCGDESYQGPTPEGCKNCNVNTPDLFTKTIIWHAKESPQSSAYRFTPDRLQFKYFGEQKRRQSGDVDETMSLQGSFFMLTREKYWELGICDESFGGWGQQGTEVALKTWLSGGSVMVDLTTWYAHMFRTQSGFAFPWGNPAKQQETARKRSMELFFNNTWSGQQRPLTWLLERFWDALQHEKYQPENGDRPWTQEDLAAIKLTESRFNDQPSRGIIYYTDNTLPTRLAHKVQDTIKQVHLPITSASLKPMDNMGHNVALSGERGPLMMFRQILAALEASTADIVYFCEHDVLYHRTHFDFVPDDDSKFFYNLNWVKVWPDGFAAHWDANQVSGLVCYRKLALEYYRGRIVQIETADFDRSYEPGSKDKASQANWSAPFPNIDVRHSGNLTKSHRSVKEFRDKASAVGFKEVPIDKIIGWNDVASILKL